MGRVLPGQAGGLQAQQRNKTDSENWLRPRDDATTRQDSEKTKNEDCDLDDFPSFSDYDLGWVGLGWVGLGWVGLGWVGLGWVGLGWVGLGWVGLGWVVLCCVVLCWGGVGWGGVG